MQVERAEEQEYQNQEADGGESLLQAVVQVLGVNLLMTTERYAMQEVIFLLAAVLF